MNRTRILAIALVLAAAFSLHAGPGLIKASTKGKLETVKELLAAGENVNEPDKNGWTPLMWATYYRHLPVTELLLEKGADPNSQATSAYASLAKGATALIIASYYGLDDQVAALVNKKAKLDLADETGNTAADYARQYNFSNVLEVLAKAPGGAAAGGGSKVFLPKGVDGTPLSKKYTSVVMEDFTAKSEISKDYAYAVTDCQTNALAVMIQRKGFEKTEMATAGKKYDETTLLVRVDITELRITSGAARFWAGAMAGNSFVHAKVTLVDAATGKVEREQLLTTENNAWGASWTAGSTDRSIPKDMGAIIAGYILTVGANK